MSTSDIAKIETQLNLKLPQFYIDTMLNYPFPLDSIAAELFLCADVQGILDNNSIFHQGDKVFAIGSDGGEFIYYIKLNGEEKVYIYDYEDSDVNHTVEAETWSDYLKDLLIGMERMKEDELLEIERKKHKKWWQFWI